MRLSLRIAWAARHFTSSRLQALTFRDEGNIEAARRFAGYARQEWAELQTLLKP